MTEQIIKLFYNKQTEADYPDEIYEGKWQLTPYTPSSIFCQGSTLKENEFIIPSQYYLNCKNNTVFIEYNKRKCILITDNSRPAIVIEGSQNNPVFLKEAQGAQSTEGVDNNLKVNNKTIPVIRTWIPGKDKNGEWEIF